MQEGARRDERWVMPVTGEGGGESATCMVVSEVFVKRKRLLNVS